MARINTKDKTERFTIRLNPQQNEFVRQMAEQQSINPSEFVRQCVDYLRITCEMSTMVTATLSDKEKTMLLSTCGSQSEIPETVTKTTKAKTKRQTNSAKATSKKSDEKKGKKSAD